MLFVLLNADDDLPTPTDARWTLPPISRPRASEKERPTALWQVTRAAGRVKESKRR